MFRLQIFVLFLVSSVHPLVYGATLPQNSTSEVEIVEKVYGSSKSQNPIATWVRINNYGDIEASHPEPAGVENLHTLYICRAQINQHYYPGKLVKTRHEHYCSVTDGYIVRRHYSGYHLLVTTPDATTWVGAKCDISVDSIGANGRSDPICRARYGQDTLVGLYNLNDLKCQVTIDNDVYSINDHIESLVPLQYTVPPCYG